MVERVRWTDLWADEDNTAELYQPGDIIVIIRGFEDGTAEIAAVRGDQTINDLNLHTERKQGLLRSSFVQKRNEQFLKRGQAIESLGVQACVLYVVSRTDANGAARGLAVPPQVKSRRIL